MSSSDSGMFKVMGVVLGSVGLFTLLCIFVARMLGAGDGGADDALMRNALIQRIEPVGMVRTSAEDLPDQQVAAAGDGGGEPKSGEELVQGACAACHQGGVGGAPMLGDEEAWAARRETGLEALVASVINGKGAMPARGGSQYTDEEIEKAVKHIALYPEEEGAADEDAAAEAPADEASAEGGAEEQAPAEDAAAAEAPTEGDEDEAAAADDDAPAEGDEATGQSAEAPAEEGAGAGDVDLMALIASGTEPDGMNDNIKTNVDGVCAGCHIAGVANAPKLGDKDAWASRAELGLDALTKSVVEGKNAMPPMGGSSLSAEEVPVAIQYLMSKP